MSARRPHCESCEPLKSDRPSAENMSSWDLKTVWPWKVPSACPWSCKPHTAEKVIHWAYSSVVADALDHCNQCNAILAWGQANDDDDDDDDLMVMVVARVHQCSPRSGRVSDGQRLLGAVLSGTWHPAGRSDAEWQDHWRWRRLVQHVLQWDWSWKTRATCRLCWSWANCSRWVGNLSITLQHTRKTFSFYF